MMLPKINFIWSFIYQSDVHSLFIKTEKYDYEEYEKYVSNFINNLKLEWKKHSEGVLNYMEEISGLKWRNAEIDCFVVKISPFYSISYPLTIPIQFEADNQVYTLSQDRYIDMLIHELIHILFVQNEIITNNYFGYLLKKKYSDEEFNAAIHVPVHAMYKKILLCFFNEARLATDIKMSDYYPDYKRAWDIVMKEGEDKILEEMKRLIGSSKGKSI